MAAPPQGDLASAGFEKAGIANQTGARDVGVGDRQGQFSSMECNAFHVPYLSYNIPEAVFHGQAVKTVAYLRVSTALLDVRSERLAILEYAHKHDFRIDDFIEATASGQASEERRQLDELMHVLQRGDRLVVSELSRPARSLGRMGRMRALSAWRWHLDEVFLKINGERSYLWRAVDQEGEVLEAFVSKQRDRKAALKLLKKLMTRYTRPDAIITDRLRSYRAGERIPTRKGYRSGHYVRGMQYPITIGSRCWCRGHSNPGGGATDRELPNSDDI